VKDYAGAVQYLYSLGNELKVGAKFGLERITAVLAELGNPEHGQRFIHVAGTNGKGSTCAFLASVLQQGGLRTGLYTSPHLVEPTERIQINGDPVSTQTFTQAFEMVNAASERLVSTGAIDAHPSYFETVTAMAFLIFRDECDLSVIEVGLGGRLDATNVITPELCIITPISYDHEAFLGNKIESIAAEKGGILKRSVPAVMARQLPAASAVVLERAAELGCPVTETSSVDMAVKNVDAHGSDFEVEGQSYRSNLAGRHQIENAVAAIAASRLLGVPPCAVQAGIRSACWPGRLEYVSRQPDFVLDGAHNPAGAAALGAYIREFCVSRPVWLVYAAMRDKAIDEVAGTLFPFAQRLILTMPDYPRALRPETIAGITGAVNATLTHSVPEAIAEARTAPQDAIVFFTGSLFLVGEARRLLVPAHV
jgi:dihydrofolate synthase/folylpolyglutamate synthase